jgi:hypothetical protein
VTSPADPNSATRGVAQPLRLVMSREPGPTSLPWSLPEKTLRRLQLATTAIGLAVIFIFFINRVIPCINLTSHLWICPVTVPVMPPVGADFHQGFYQPAMLWRNDQSPYSMVNVYPPFVTVVGLPFTLLKPLTAYVVFALGLFLANVMGLWLAISLAISVFAGRWPRTLVQNLGQTLLVALAFLHFTSYGFEFSFERGNYDAWPGLFSLLAVWLLVHRPGWFWPQLILLSLAVHLKIYPAILFILLFWRHRWRSILPAVVVNGGLACILGWRRIPELYSWLKVAMFGNSSTTINHSGISFWESVMVPLFDLPVAAGKLALVFPFTLWAIGVVVLWRRGPTPVNLVRLYTVSLPLMNVVPSLSFDYKLVILTAPLAIVLLDSVLKFAGDGSRRAGVTVMVLLLVAGVMSRSYLVATQYWLANKYPCIVLIQLLALLAALVSRDSPTGGTGALPDRCAPRVASPG